MNLRRRANRQQQAAATVARDTGGPSLEFKQGLWFGNKNKERIFAFDNNNDGDRQAKTHPLSLQSLPQTHPGIKELLISTNNGDQDSALLVKDAVKRCFVLYGFQCFQHHNQPKAAQWEGRPLFQWGLCRVKQHKNRRYSLTLDMVSGSRFQVKRTADGQAYQVLLNNKLAKKTQKKQVSSAACASIQQDNETNRWSITHKEDGIGALIVVALAAMLDELVVPVVRDSGKVGGEEQETTISCLSSTREDSGKLASITESGEEKDEEEEPPFFSLQPENGLSESEMIRLAIAESELESETEGGEDESEAILESLMAHLCRNNNNNTSSVIQGV